MMDDFFSVPCDEEPERISLEGFELVSERMFWTARTPTIGFKPGELLLNDGIRSVFPGGEAVMLAINEAGRSILIIPPWEKWHSTVRTDERCISSVQFSSYVYKLMGWNRERYWYAVEGSIVKTSKGEGLIFDLDDAFIYDPLWDEDRDYT